MNKIKYCIWDVGGVIYHYTLAPLFSWCEAHSADKEKFNRNKKALDYDEYMKGKVSFSDFCRQCCDLLGVVFQEELLPEIREKLYEGIGRYYPETRKVQEQMVKLGITNGILSNALPEIADRIECRDLMDEEHIFCSFNLELLKPDIKIYEALKNRLCCEFNEIIFIDNKEENVTAAAKLGIHAILFTTETIEEEINKVLG